MMRRRTFLAASGALFSAGCSEIIPPPRTTRRTGTNTGTADGTPSDTVPTPGPQETEPGPGETTGQSTEATETTEAGTETPTQAERTAADAIATARTDLTDALTAYVDFADGDEPTLLDVTAATKVSVSAVTGPVSDVNTTLDEIPEGASTAQKETAQRLRGVGAFLRSAINCQVPLHNAYSKFRFVTDRIYAESYGSIPSEVSQMRDRADAANGHLQTLQSGSDRTDTQAFAGISESLYDQKVDQLQRSVTGFETLADTLTSVSDGVEAFGKGTSDFTEDQYDNAENQFTTANEDLRTAVGELDGLAVPDSITTDVADLRSVVSALSACTPHLVDASNAGSADRNAYWSAFDNAIAELDAATDAIGRLESVTDLETFHEESKN